MCIAVLGIAANVEVRVGDDLGMRICFRGKMEVCRVIMLYDGQNLEITALYSKFC